MNYLLSKMICIQGQDRTLPFTNPRVKRQSGHYTLRAAEGAFRCGKGRPVTTVHQARARQGVSRGRGPPDMEADHARHGTGVSAGGRPSPRSADQYEGASMRAVGRFLANSLGYVASEHDYIGARPFAREESESAKGPFKPQGAPSGKSLGRIREDRYRRTSVKADKNKRRAGLMPTQPIS